MGISGNERADSAAKAALQKDISNCLISYTDTYQYISQYVRDMWQREWDTAVNNKLHSATKPLIGELPSAYRSVRRCAVKNLIYLSIYYHFILCDILRVL